MTLLSKEQRYINGQNSTKNLKKHNFTLYGGGGHIRPRDEEEGKDIDLTLCRGRGHTRACDEEEGKNLPVPVTEVDAVSDEEGDRWLL